MCGSVWYGMAIRYVGVRFGGACCGRVRQLDEARELKKIKRGESMDRTIQMPEHKELMDHVLLSSIGTVLTHNDIADKMMLKACSNRYRSEIYKANKELVKYNRQLVSQRGEGYKIVGADGMVEIAFKLLERSKSRSKHAVTIVQNIDKNNLISEESKIKYDTIATKINNLYASLSGGLVEVKLIQKPIIRKNKEMIR